jgi:hypothetical protein
MDAYTVQDLRFDSVPTIQCALDTLTTGHLRVPAEGFRAKIVGSIGQAAGPVQAEGANDNQSIHMLRFHWGHDHDFGTFQVPGCMGTRHVWMLSRFFDHFGLEPSSLSGKKVLDIGCWTGGVSLVLARMGARTLATDEIGMYSEMLAYEAMAFGLDNLEAQEMSLYDLESTGHTGEFDVVFLLGVLYHLSDPIVSLRRIYNCMKPGGSLYLESMCIDSGECVCEYEGPSRRRGQFGWNWFVPSPKAIQRMLADAGFGGIRVGNGIAELAATCDVDPMGAMRCFAVANKRSGHVICKAGLSVRVS